MRIYTRSGDKGTTSLVYGKRVDKDDSRVEAYGTCDEANSMIGLAVSYLDSLDWNEKAAFLQQMHRIQTILFHVGSELATPPDREVAWKLSEAHVKELEEQIDKWDETLPSLTQFILPSGHTSSSALQVARTIVRRAERIAVGIDQVNPLVLSYLNRLSDYLFVAARYVNNQLGRKEAILNPEI